MFETTLQIIEIFVVRFFIPAAFLFGAVMFYVIKTENPNARHKKVHLKNQIKEPFDLISHFHQTNH